MKVFISWSGEESREIALALKDWFPRVIQGVTPFVSAKDIDKGSNWVAELSRQLSDSDFGVICLTPANLLSPWLNYEAGAITSSMDSRVCPVLHGVSKEEVRAPLSQLQLTDLNMEEVILLMESMRKASNSTLTPPELEDAVGVWWPWLDEKIRKISVPTLEPVSGAPLEPPKPEISIEEMLHEILARIRSLEQLSAKSIGRTHSFSEREDEGRSEIVRVARRVLRRDGLESPVFRFDRGGLVIILTEEIPSPVPAETYMYLADLSKSLGMVQLKSEIGRVVHFINGAPDEPME